MLIMLINQLKFAVNCNDYEGYTIKIIYIFKK
jgi:hypothetical protein